MGESNNATNLDIRPPYNLQKSVKDMIMFFEETKNSANAPSEMLNRQMYVYENIYENINVRSSKQLSTTCYNNVNIKSEEVDKLYTTLSETSNKKADLSVAEKIIEELLKTEETYIESLIHANQHYFYHFKNELAQSVQYIIDDFQHLTLYQTSFYSKLVLCKSNSESLADCFLKNNYLFEFYVKYISKMNDLRKTLTTRYKELVEKQEKKINDKLNLEAHLLTPFQRLTRYLLLLKRLLQELEGNPNVVLKEAIIFLENLTETLNISAEITPTRVRRKLSFL